MPAMITFPPLSLLSIAFLAKNPYSITQISKRAVIGVKPKFTMSTSMSSAEERLTRPIRTAACLIIGDEVLGGKIKDTNSYFMAKWCFKHGIDLKRIETIGDEEEEIVEAVRKLSSRYDFVVTSGGIGPTHDDITYQSIAKAFQLPLRLYETAFDRMKKLTSPDKLPAKFSWDEKTPTLTARLRMVELPTDPSYDIEKQFYFPCEDTWVPVCAVNGNIHILPGIPSLFEKLLDGLDRWVIPRLALKKSLNRVLISTPLTESEVASFLTELAAKVQDRGVKVGSYPRTGHRNTVTLVGNDQEYLESLVPETLEGVQGRRVQFEGEDDHLE